MSKKTEDFSRQLEELEAIIDWFESEDIDLYSAMTNFEKGLELANELKKQLRAAENRFTEIKQRFDLEADAVDDTSEE